MITSTHAIPAPTSIPIPARLLWVAGNCSWIIYQFFKPKSKPKIVLDIFKSYP